MYVSWNERVIDCVLSDKNVKCGRNFVLCRFINRLTDRPHEIIANRIVINTILPLSVRQKKIIAILLMIDQDVFFLSFSHVRVF